MHPFHILLAAFAILSLVAFGLLFRWEGARFAQRGQRQAWLRVRLATVPIALVAAAMAVLPARATPGMEGLAVFYVLLLTVVPLWWFGAHWLVGRTTTPRLVFRESAQIALSPLAGGYVLALAAQSLQAPAWSLLRRFGVD